MREHRFDKIPCGGSHRSPPLNQPALAPNVCQSVSTEPGRQCGAAGQAKGAGPRRLGPTRQTKARHEAGVHGKELRKRVVEILDGQRPARFEDAFEFGNGVANSASERYCMTLADQTQSNVAS